VEAYKQKMLETWAKLPLYFVTSSSSSLGREDLLNYINGLNEEVFSQNK